MKKLIPFYAFLVIFLSFFLTGCTNNETKELSNSLVKEAKELYEQREYKNALERYGEALEIYPRNAKAYFGITDILIEKGYFEEATGLAKEASLRLTSKESSHLYLKIGDAYYEEGDYGNAEKTFKKALEEEKTYYKAQLSMAKINIHNGKINEARKNIDNVRGRDQDKAEYVILKTYLTLDDLKEGEKVIKKIDDKKVEDEIQKKQIKTLKKIYSLDEDKLFKKAHLSKEYINAGYPGLAISLLEKNSSKIEEYWDGQYFLGKAYFDIGNMDKALEKLNNAVLLDVDETDMYLLLARIYSSKGDIDKSLQSYQRAMQIMEDSEREYVTEEYVKVLLENNMLNSARAILEDEKESPWVYLLMCEVSLKQKNATQMLKSLESLESMNLNLEEEKEYFKYKTYYEINNIEDVKAVQKLIEEYKHFDQYNPFVYLFSSKLSLHLEEKQEAKDALHRAIELDLEGNVTQEARKILATIK